VVTGFARADAVASLVVVALMLKAGSGLVRDSGRIFLEAAPAGVDPPALGARLAALPDVVEIHDLHVWQITSGQPALSAHVLVTEDRDCHAARLAIESILRDDYKITHSTLQVDHALPPADPMEHCIDQHGEAYRSGPR
jgi:cobalt-zinc-cadmium efflux system protein